ncbi:Sad1/UNC domain protein [Talaromyces stipitatus ATCC 10500]|uniref:Sad1/UNC domain protein n=1 Tax=Talaromyces stipitatus (strain ATCC 10500 / CBS 375.48 / QM 6759 / NRRL 1006) TaxID=441959 RepID=B8MBQ2_TALSN|nr:Sad1/UNC domain protein [Talaromyces stipitatus ATCC 10500]EED18185.1 Sad1/UNC domain protein [Talaromyces stipitatus ATCC 10500]
MTGACIIQVLRWMQVWVLLASDFLAHATASQLQVQSNDNQFLICHAPSFYDVIFPICSIYDESGRGSDYVSIVPTEPSATTTSTTGAAQSSPPPVQDTDVNELDADSALDTADFLSFEDWKKRNLAKIGQSADNVGGKRQGGDIGQERRTQARAINNALDALGDDAEIELNFDGFGSESAQATPWESGSGNEKVNSDGETSVDNDSADGVSAVGRRKDAGTTCKERFNYASFDCAATVLKTNPECSGSSSILIENKDSYMLNECRAKNKFLILELCDDILVDTIVLANYEFFSSIFRTFRVSVSDRYPVKADKWKELGIFEAKNTRAVQAFAVENPLIWARYVKIEFLTHYGNEFYCPLSLVRVHGTTMLEEYKNEGDASRSDEEVMETAEEVGRPVEDEQEISVQGQGALDNSTVPISNPILDIWESTSPLNGSVLEMAALEFSTLKTATCAADYSAIETPDTLNQTAVAASTGSANITIVTPSDSKASPEQTINGDMNMASRVGSQNATTRGSAQDSSTVRTSVASGEDSTSAVEPTKVIPSSPPSPNPTTQESFFKSVNKRLQMLESNSTLSLLYIEEQSRMLRDAFSKVEKRQMAKMNTFLEDLNNTVIDEIRNLHMVYQSLRTIVLDDFEHQQREVSTAASQLAILTNELVFQKRMTALSSVLIMILFALILFPRGSGIVGGIDFQSMITWSPRPKMSRSSRIPSTGPSSPSLESETQTPPTVNPSKKKAHRRQCSNALRHESIKDLRECANSLAHSSEEDLQFSGYEDNGRFRSMSDFSDSDISKIPYTPFSSDIQHMLGYDAVRMRPQINVVPDTTASSPSPSPLPSVPQDRPVSSPPVLKAAPSVDHPTNGDHVDDIQRDDSDAESDTSTEPFPPFPTD